VDSFKRDSGIKPNITRRDFLNGVAMASAVSLFPNLCLASVATTVPLRAATNSSIYPPALSGMRGNHDGSFEVLHELAMAGKSQWGSLNNLDQHYDLIIVGAGLSGLSAAHFYRQKHPQATILILDNHDDFGGHAKRNEFKLGEQTLVGYGGSQTMQEPNFYPNIVKQLLSDIGVDLNRLAAGYDTEFF
jgi:spermidine dehydrogenase